MKIGLALGAGGAKGLVHIGILKVLHKQQIYPHYIAGTSMGAVIGAMYAAGFTPEEIEDIAKTTDWKKIVDFTVPKAGLISGNVAENRLNKLLRDKQFKDLAIPLKVAAYNLTKKERVIFRKGSVAKAVRASLSIPGIFAPLRLGNSDYIDGAVADPTPFDVVQEMGADVVIAVDLYSKTKTARAPQARKSTFFQEMQQQFIGAELLNIKNYVFPTRWPRFARRVFNWVFDKLLYPARIMRIIAGKELPVITRVMYETVHILTNNLAKERLKNAEIDVTVTPSFGNLKWADFDQVDKFVKIGEQSMKRKVPQLKKKLRLK